MPINRKLQNIIGTEHITDSAESAIAAQASGGATVAFKNVAVSGQDNIVADAATDTLTLVGGSNVTITTDASADSVTIAAAGGGGSAFAPTPQVFRQGSGGSTNPRTTLTALTPYGFPIFQNTNHPTTLQRVFFFPFIAPETVAITKLSVYVSSANASSPNVLLGIYTATEAGSGTTLQRTPNALQMTASVATTSTGYQDATVSAYSGGSTTITEGTLYYAAYARAASTAGGSQLQGVQSTSRAQISVSIGNANQVAINNGSGQGGEHSDGDALAASYPSAYPSSKTTSTTTLHIMYRVD